MRIAGISAWPYKIEVSSRVDTIATKAERQGASLIVLGLGEHGVAARLFRRETALRVSVQGGGCSGFRYDFDIVQSAAKDDLVIEKLGARVVIDPVSIPYMEGSEIDFVDDLIGASFRIHNPNATASCGCGTSFSL